MTTPEVVAVLEDNLDVAQKLEAQLSEIGIRAHLFYARDDFKHSIERGDHYDAVILDWFFVEPDSSTLAQLVLADLRKQRYVPVLVYTEQLDVAEAEIRELQRPFDRISIFDKETNDPKTLATKVGEWYEGSMGGRLSVVWRDARRRAFEESLYDLDSFGSESLYRTLRHILVMDAGQAHDVDHALEFLERYVGRKLFSNPALRAALSEELKEAQGQNMKAEGDKETALVHAHRYAFPADGVARTGDIVEVLSSPEGKLLMIAAVLTPACDLDTAKCVELRLVVAEERAGDAKGYSEALLPAVRGPSDTVYRHFIVQFHRTFFAKDVSVGQTPQARGGKVIHYDHDFEDALGHKLRLRPVCRLDDPYRADLLQKYASHASRVGIP